MSPASSPPGFGKRQTLCLDLIRPFANVINTHPGVVTFYLRRFNSLKMTRAVRMAEFQKTVSILVRKGWLSAPVAAFPEAEGREIAPVMRAALQIPFHPEFYDAITVAFIGYCNDQASWLEFDINKSDVPDLGNYEYIEFEMANFYAAIVAAIRHRQNVENTINALELLQQGTGYPRKMLPMWEQLAKLARLGLRQNEEEDVLELFLQISFSFLMSGHNNDLPSALLMEEVKMIKAEIGRNHWGDTATLAYRKAQMELAFAGIIANDGEIESAIQSARQSLETFLKYQRFEEAFSALSLVIQAALKKADKEIFSDCRKYMAMIYPKLRSPRMIGEYCLLESDILAFESKVKEAKEALKNADKQFKRAMHRIGQAQVQYRLSSLRNSTKRPLKDVIRAAENAAAIFFAEERFADYELARLPVLLDAWMNFRWEEVATLLDEMEAEYRATHRVNLLFIVTFFKIISSALQSDSELMADALQQLSQLEEDNIRKGLWTLAELSRNKDWISQASHYLHKTPEEIEDIVAQENQQFKNAKKNRSKPK
jgi:hypothetical protein